MAFFRRKLPPIKVGDLFRKFADRTEKKWAVSRLWTTVDGIPHARLKNLDETLAVSIITLSDPEFFTAVLPSVTED